MLEEEEEEGIALLQLEVMVDIRISEEQVEEERREVTAVRLSGEEVAEVETVQFLEVEDHQSLAEMAAPLARQELRPEVVEGLMQQGQGENVG